MRARPPQTLTVCGACAPLCRLDRDHPERVQFAAFIGDRDIFAGCKLMGAEAIAQLVVIIALGIVVEHPPGMLGTTRLMDQASGLVLLTLPKSANATLVAMGLPSLGIDMSLGVQRSNELIAVICDPSGCCFERASWRRIDFKGRELFMGNSLC